MLPKTRHTKLSFVTGLSGLKGHHLRSRQTSGMPLSVSSQHGATHPRALSASTCAALRCASTSKPRAFGTA